MPISSKSFTAALAVGNVISRRFRVLAGKIEMPVKPRIEIAEEFRPAGGHQ